MDKDQLKAYFYFSRKERNAVLVLLILVAIFFIVPYIVPRDINTKEAIADTAVKKAMANLSTYKDSGYTHSYYKERDYYYKSRYPAGSYRRKGTSYYNYAPHPEYTGNSYKSEHHAHVIPDIYINAADTSDLLPLPGIGIKLAVRIIAFRDKLGGFYDIGQVAETYGLPDSTFQQIKEKLKLGKQEITRININTADAATLKQHPYIRWNLSNAIVEYRKQHGSFKALNELLQIGLITADIYQKIAPYLTTDAER